MTAGHASGGFYIESEKRVQAQAGGLSELKDTVIIATSKARRRDCCIIDPRHSKFLTFWDATLAVALIFTAVVTPYEVAFLPARNAPKRF